MFGSLSRVGANVNLSGLNLHQTLGMTLLFVSGRKSALDQIAYAKGIGSKILQYFETYFDVKYPLPKQVRALLP